VARLLGQSSELSALRTEVEPSGRAVLERLLDPADPVLSLARVRDHARRLDRGPFVEPFLADGRLAEALSIVRWWR
jgi:hypothetical protein